MEITKHLLMGLIHTLCLRVFNSTVVVAVIFLLDKIPDEITWWFVRDFRDNKHYQDTQHYHINIHICLALGATNQSLDSFLESNSRNCDVILSFIITFSDALPLYYAASDNRRKYVMNNCT